MSVDATAYRQAIANFATGVTVITSQQGDRPVGMTASAVTSLSLDPILLLVCISSRLPTHAAIAEHGSFAVNVLGDDSKDLAHHFATPMANKFAGIRLRDDGSGLPILVDAIAHFTCDVERALEGGDHTIFVGRVSRCECSSNAQPLLYFRSTFGRLEMPDDFMRRTADLWESGW